MKLSDLLFLILATFYLSHAVTGTKGPAGAFEWLRAHLPLGGLIPCFVCLSLWLSAAFYALLQTSVPWLVYIPAGAGAAVLLWRYTGGNHVQGAPDRAAGIDRLYPQPEREV